MQPRERSIFTLKDIFFKLTIKPFNALVIKLFSTLSFLHNCYHPSIPQDQFLDFAPILIASFSHGLSLSGFVNQWLEELYLANRSVRVFVHALEILLEGTFVKLGVWFDSLEHTTTEFTHFVLLQLAVSIRVNACEQLFSCCHELGLTDIDTLSLRLYHFYLLSL